MKLLDGRGGTGGAASGPKARSLTKAGAFYAKSVMGRALMNS